MFDRLSPAARDVITAGTDEAYRCGDRRLGTDHLLLGLFHDPATAALIGVDLQRARAESGALDRQALAAIGVNLGASEPAAPARAGRHAPLTSGVRAVIPRALDLAAAEAARRVEPRHLLLALLERAEPDPAAVLLAALGLDRAGLRARAAMA
ncbi:Clp protease N-terminal domain-containing protein [Specibacter cremeus]|uniref:Clp protease N-terminal domain-containing protein n=1 Tax=Specibacter cremeus TaxID=1629051 RepID=UPI000F7840C3|nr:Clp protease N-terminal domain-containing protein [Specibacter cremeus]